MAQRVTELSARHGGKIPGDEIRKLMWKKTLAPVLPKFAQAGVENVPKANILMAWSKVKLDRMFDSTVQLEAIRMLRPRIFGSRVGIFFDR